jgi:hypothetical protein
VKDGIDISQYQYGSISVQQKGDKMNVVIVVVVVKGLLSYKSPLLDVPF